MAVCTEHGMSWKYEPYQGGGGCHLCGLENNANQSEITEIMRRPDIKQGISAMLKADRFDSTKNTASGNGRIRAKLEFIEWSDPDDKCPLCEKTEAEGHTETCKLLLAFDRA